MSETNTSYGRDVWMALAAIGWADGELSEEEADAILRAAIESGLNIEQVADLEAAAKVPSKLGDINLASLTKEDRLFIYAIACWLSRVDGKITSKEREALQQLGDILKLPEKPRLHAEHIAVEVADPVTGYQPAFYHLPKVRQLIIERLDSARRLRAASQPGTGNDAEDEA